jgi:hypothetical protein
MVVQGLHLTEEALKSLHIFHEASLVAVFCLCVYNLTFIISEYVGNLILSLICGPVENLIYTYKLLSRLYSLYISIMN